MILPSNVDTDINTDTTSNKIKTSSSVLTTKINIDGIDGIYKTAIKKETYYKMKFIMNSLNKNWAIKKRENIFYLKNLDNSTKEIITEDYLNKCVLKKVYGDSITLPSSSGEKVNKINNNQNKNIKKDDIIPLKDGILALKELIDKETTDINKEVKQEIYVMIFLMNTLDDGWCVRKKNNNFIFRKKHNHKKEIYSDDYLVTFLQHNMKNIIA